MVQRITHAPQLASRTVGKYLMPTERVVTTVRMHPAAIISSVLWILGGAILAGLLTGDAHGNGTFVLVIWLLWGVLFVWQGWKIATWWRRYFRRHREPADAGYQPGFHRGGHDAACEGDRHKAE